MMVGGGRSSYCASTPTLRTADFLTHRLRQEGGRACARKEGHELERRACVEAGIPLPAHRCVGGGAHRWWWSLSAPVSSWRV